MENQEHVNPYFQSVPEGETPLFSSSRKSSRDSQQDRKMSSVSEIVCGYWRLS